MPKYDGTGPCGRGQQTGRGMGHCASGARMGGCCGFRRFRSAKNEFSALEEEEESILKEELKAIEEEKKVLISQK